MSMAAQIELYLLTRGDWVSGKELCQRFNIAARSLRADGGPPRRD